MPPNIFNKKLDIRSRHNINLRFELSQAKYPIGLINMNCFIFRREPGKFYEAEKGKVVRFRGKAKKGRDNGTTSGVSGGQLLSYFLLY